jgi:L-alanine-DL-glutamate epimerase-like enolase superfamily enzyme
MKIERIEAIPLAMPLPQPLKAGTVSITRRATIFTRVFTSEGVVGECFSNNENAGQKQIVSIIHDEIAPLLRAKCVTCHRPGEIGSWAITNHATVRAKSAAIRANVLEGLMPPWHADPEQ